MEDDDHEEEQEEEPSYESLGNSSIFKITSESGDPSASTHKPPTRYRECLKNHAVSLGRHAVDGCGEFIPLGLENTPDSLKCAACNCHRNFHRKEDTQQHDISPYYRTTPTGYPHVSQHYRPLPLPSSSGGGTHSREDQDDVSNPSGSGGSRKRFRTKFTQEQKEKMLGFAEKLGWKIQKQDEGLVEEFCNDTCIKRRVLKVWMHNNKYTLGKNPNPNNNVG